MDKFARISMISGYDRDFLSGLKVLVIGAGAIGNEIVKNLALFGVGEILIVDFDTIEIHNLTRSIFFREDDIGRPKASTVAKRASEIAPETNIHSKDGNFWDCISIAETKNFDVVVCSVDNFEARIKANTLCRLASVPMINTGIDHRYVSIDIFPFNANDTCACYECSIPSSVYEKIGQRYSCGWIRKVYHKEKTVPTTAVTASCVGSIAVSQLFELLNSKLHQANIKYGVSRRILFDTLTLNITKTIIMIKEMCPSHLHGSKKIKYIADSRNFHREKSLFVQVGQDQPSTYVHLSDPIITHTERNGNLIKTIFDLAENYDESFLMIDGERLLDAHIVDGLFLDELSTKFKSFDIPTKFVILENDKLEFNILLEMKNE
jgi:molybdopterin-synthase adenylyltransferase